MFSGESVMHGRNDEDFAGVYASFSAGFRYADASEGVIAAAKRNVLDTLACAIAGVAAPGVSEVRELVRGWGGAGLAPIWCSGIRVPAQEAALVNSMMAHARDYDDTHDGAVLHAGVSVVPAALAAAALDKAASGADLLAGVIVGLELVCRLGCAATESIVDTGFIYSSLMGYFGAAVAAARVLRLSVNDTRNALGIAYSQAAGTHQVTRDSALMKRMQPGLAARAGLLAVQLSRSGISGARGVFEGEDGLYRTYLRSGYSPTTLREGLGRRFELTNLSYKAYPCCRFNHTGIDAALTLQSRLPLGVAAVSAIDARVNRQAYEAVCTPFEVRRQPATIVDAQFSLPYTIACALTDGAVRLEHFTSHGIGRTDILDLASKVTCSVDPGIEARWSRSISPTRISITLADGRAFSAFRQTPSGDARTPMSSLEVEQKLDDCIAFSELGLSGDTAQRLRAMIDSVETLPQGDALNGVLVC